MRACILACLCAVLAACSPPSVPDVNYFRMPPPTPLPHAGKPLTTLPIVVSVFSGEGIYSEQALIYATTPDASSLRTYHYQLWSDPPTRGLQSRLTQMLRASGIAPFVTERLPASDPALRVHATIERYDRINRDNGYVVDVAFEIRVEQGAGEPVIEKTYRAEAAASDGTIASTVRAFGVAVDQSFAKFYSDLAALGGGGDAG